MATGGENEQQHSTQQGIQDTTIDYYDIMVIGKTGMGKSTTADKLLIANMDGRDYSGEQHSEPVVKEKQLTLDNLSVWLLSSAPDEELRVKTRLKNLIFFRSMAEPHKEINGFHAGEQHVSGMTLSCELISNESTKVRVLDVPGFFGQGDTGAHEASAGEKAQCTIKVALGTMRNILQIQAAMNMKFRRILYFLPEQGTLSRSSSLLELELTTLANYFGRAIFDCMVVITTLPAVVYKYTTENVVISEDDWAQTRKYFDIALSGALPKEKNIPKPPIVFISLTDSCEMVFNKINEVVVASDRIELEFDSMVCARCGIKAKVIKSEKIAAYTDEREFSTIPYDESTCHPLLIPKYTKVKKFFGGVAHLLTMWRFRGKWPSFHSLDEVCIACQKQPGSRGCMKVNSKYTLKGGDLIVEHTQGIDEPVVFLPGEGQSESEEDRPTRAEQTISYSGSMQNPINVSSGVSDDGHTPYDDTKG